MCFSLDFTNGLSLPAKPVITRVMYKIQNTIQSGATGYWPSVIRTATATGRKLDGQKASKFLLDRNTIL